MTKPMRVSEYAIAKNLREEQKKATVFACGYLMQNKK